MSTVSVIIPSYNRANIIAETIDNMLSQTLFPHEVIVVDDGSTDNSLEVIKRFGDKVKLITQSNKGPGAARNAGLKIATGEYIQFMDSDDLASLNKLEVQAAVLDKHKGDIVYGPWVKLWVDNKQVRLMDVVLQQQPLPSKRSPLEWFLTDWSMVFQQCLVRRSLLQQIGGYREDMRLFEDGDLFIRLLLAGGKIVHENQSLTFYRLDDFGKLTASGEAHIRRAIDQAKFFQMILSLSAANSCLKSAIQHPAFTINVWNVIKDLQKQGCFNEQIHASLSNYIKNKSRITDLQLLLKNKKAGIRQRIKGHRWPTCYQAGKLTSYHQQLVADLNWSIIE